MSSSESVPRIKALHELAFEVPTCVCESALGGSLFPSTQRAQQAAPGVECEDCVPEHCTAVGDGVPVAEGDMCGMGAPEIPTCFCACRT